MFLKFTRTKANEFKVGLDNGNFKVTEIFFINFIPLLVSVFVIKTRMYVFLIVLVLIYVIEYCIAYCMDVNQRKKASPIIILSY